MIKVERFINQLMGSNCYLVVDETLRHCVCVDPASEKSEREIEYIEQNGLSLDFIFLTHEHTDHTWGVNALLEHFPEAKVVCSTLCRDALSKEASAYFQLYYDNPNYSYNVQRVDFTTEELGCHLDWGEHRIVFIPTPGHSPGSVCIELDGVIIGGDTLMSFKPVIKKRIGGSMEQFKDSVKKILMRYYDDTLVYPGHGEILFLKDIHKI